MILDDKTDIVFSPDDEDMTDKGWYLIQYKGAPSFDSRTSELYATKAEALKAYREGTVKWEEWS